VEFAGKGSLVDIVERYFFGRLFAFLAENDLVNALLLLACTALHSGQVLQVNFWLH
jgi:hypothetical protein